MSLGSTLSTPKRAERATPPRSSCYDRRAKWLSPTSPRLEQVKDLIARGLRNKEIASQLGISEASVKQYVWQLTKRTGMNRNQIMMGRLSFYLPVSAAEGDPRLGAFE